MKSKLLYTNFNKHKKQPKRSNIRCGGIIFTENKKHIVIVQNRYLLDEQGKILWGLPKGHIKENETYAQCARREIKEETGINVHITEHHPKIKINNTFYFPIKLGLSFVQLQNIMHVNDTIEIQNISLLDLCDLKNKRSILNYELRKFIEMYINRAKKIATISDSSSASTKYFTG